MENSYASINFIFAKPYREHYYVYGVNNVDVLTVIPKDDLRKLLFEKLGCESVDKMEYVFSRNLAFIYETDTKKVRKFKDISPDLTQEDLGKHFIKELKMGTRKNMPSLSTRCRNLFGR